MSSSIELDQDKLNISKPEPILDKQKITKVQDENLNTIMNFPFLGPLQIGLADMNAEEIKIVQKGLNEVLSKDLVDNGHYGCYTEKIVKEFQEKFGLKTDGIFNEFCWNILRENLKKKQVLNVYDEKTLKLLELEENRKLQKELQNKESSEILANLEKQIYKDL